MVELKEVKESYEIFRSGFLDIVDDFNKEKGDLSREEITQRVKQSDLYQRIKDYMEERGWSVLVEADFHIDFQKGGETRGVPIIQEGHKRLVIPPWGRVWGQLERPEEFVNK